jgi:hypothetical protein
VDRTREEKRERASWDSPRAHGLVTRGRYGSFVRYRIRDHRPRADKDSSLSIALTWVATLAAVGWAIARC